MVWPPSTHQDVQDAVTALRTATANHYVTANVTSGYTVTTSFQTVPHNLVSSTDTSAWDSTNHTWAAPVAGLYDISGLVRVTDGYGAGYNVGVGIDLSNGDSSVFAWYPTTASYRHTFIYARVAHFSAGDLPRMFLYMDGGPATIVNAAMGIALIAAD